MRGSQRSSCGTGPLFHLSHRPTMPPPQSPGPPTLSKSAGGDTWISLSVQTSHSLCALVFVLNAGAAQKAQCNSNQRMKKSPTNLLLGGAHTAHLSGKPWEELWFW